MHRMHRMDGEKREGKKKGTWSMVVVVSVRWSLFPLFDDVQASFRSLIRPSPYLMHGQNFFGGCCTN